MAIEASAQGLQPVFDPTGKSGSPPPLEKEKPLQPKPAPLLPPVPPPRAPAEQKGPLIRVFVKEVRLGGNRVFSAAQLAEVTTPYTNRELTTEDLETLRLAITVFYINKGYPSHQSQEIVRELKMKQADATYCELPSTYGHDAFLLEVEDQTTLIRHFLDKTFNGYHVASNDEISRNSTRSSDHLPDR